jgi:hypothetical protein
MPFCPLSHWKRHVLALVLFGTAFGYLEAAVVSYLRYLQQPIRQHLYPAQPVEDLFPLLRVDQAAAAGPQQRKLRFTEIGREAATIVMLAAVALTISKNLAHWAAAFVVALGSWDIIFYLFLKLLLGWPASLFTWDILFIVPVPWVAPVIAPVVVSSAMVLAGIWHLRCEARANPARLGTRNWVCLVTGAAMIVISFTLDSANVRAGGMPRPFAWLVFGMGMTIGLLGYIDAALTKDRKPKIADHGRRIVSPPARGLRHHSSPPGNQTTALCRCKLRASLAALYD